jgi:hypothetical protein
VLCFVFAKAQKQTIMYADTTKLEYIPGDSSTKGAARGLFRIGFGGVGFGYQYSHPNKGEFAIGYSMFTGAYSNVLIPIYSYSRAKKTTVGVKHVFTALGINAYHVKGQKVVDRNIIGLHGGVRYFYERAQLRSPLRLALYDHISKNDLFPYTGLAYMGGIGFFKTRSFKFSWEDNKGNEKTNSKFTTKTGVYFDFMYYPNLDFKLFNPLTNQMEPYTDFSKYGYLVHFETTKVASNKESYHGWGTIFQVAIGTGPNLSGIIGFVGFGLAF